MSARRQLPFLAAVALLALLPLFFKGYYLEFLTVTFYWIGLASCWNLMSGHTGYIDFGSVTYVGVGSYVAGVLMLKSGWPLMPAVLAAGGFCLALALAVGYPTLKLRGAYFAIATFALAEAVKQVAEEWEGLTEGGIGLTIPGRLDSLSYYWLYLGLTALLIWLTWFISHSRLGYALKAIHQDEHAASRVGIDTHRIKMTAYCLSACFIGLFGALDATRLSYIKPDDAFSVQTTIKMVIMSLLGGMGTVFGPAIGATFLKLIEDYLGAEFLNYYLIIVGVVIVVVIISLPQGIAGGLANRLGALRRSRS